MSKFSFFPVSMNFKSYFITLLFVIITVTSFGQEAVNQTEVVKDKLIDQLVEKHREYNQANPGVDGFRVQIFFDSGNNSKRAATTVREHFMELYPQTVAYLTFKSPYYRVRVGDFRTKLEAEGFLLQLSSQYPNAFSVPDRVLTENKGN
jgi:hypothetical protein